MKTFPLLTKKLLLCIFSSVWALWYAWSCEFRQKLYPHFSYSNGFSSLWSFSWAKMASSPFHTLQFYRFSPGRNWWTSNCELLPIIPPTCKVSLNCGPSDEYKIWIFDKSFSHTPHIYRDSLIWPNMDLIMGSSPEVLPTLSHLSYFSPVWTPW